MTLEWGLALKETGGWIHHYDFEHAKEDEGPFEKVRGKVSRKLESLNAAFDFSFDRIVRSTEPNWYQVVPDISIKH